MRNPADGGVRGPLLLMLAILLVGQANDAWWVARGMHGPQLLQAVSGFMFSFTSFVWYCRDSDAHGYRRSLLRNIGMIFASLLFVPWYVARSRAPGQKWRALFRLAGYCLLMLLAMALGMMLIAFISA